MIVLNTTYANKTSEGSLAFLMKKNLFGYLHGGLKWEDVVIPS